MRKAAKRVAIIALGLAFFFVLIKTMSERHDYCTCNDGAETHGWSTGWTKASSNCAELCAQHGGVRSSRYPD